MKPKIIQTAKEHEKALKHVEALMDAKPGSAQEEELELWVLLIERYEQEQFPIEEPDPIEAIKFRMDQLGLKPKDLRVYIGQKSKVSEVLNRKRPLSLSMIRALHNKLGIPAAILVQEPKLAKKRSPLRAGRVGKTVRRKRTQATKKKATKKQTSRA